MRHCHFHFFRKIRFSLCLSLFLIGLGIFCAAVCKCADSDTWIVQFLTNPQADSGKSSSDADAPDAASASDASSENTTALNAAFTDYVTELFRQEASANRTFITHWQILPLTVSRTIRHLSEPALQILLPWLQPLLKICLPDCNNFNRLNYRLKIG